MENQYIALKDPRLYVLTWLSLYQVSINERGELIDPLRRKNDEIFDTLWLDYRAQVRDWNQMQEERANKDRRYIRSVAETDMKKAVNELISKEKNAFRQATVKTMKNEGEDLSQVEKFTKVLLGKEDNQITAILAHWVWLVKNKMRGSRVSYHIMPIFYGKQGGGKTVATNKFLEPLLNYTLNIKMSQLVDERYFFSLSENYCVFFDEMSGASRTDVDALKNQITTDFNDVRKLGTNSISKVAQSCSFIGATNRPLNEQILDSTGMRRFYEIRVIDKLDWDLLESIDFNKLWKGVDENKVDGYIVPFLGEIGLEQQKHVLEEELDVFIREFKIDFNQKETIDIKADDLYQIYTHWAQAAGFKPMNKVWFGKKFINKGAKKAVKNINGKTYNVYVINKTAGFMDNFISPVILPTGERTWQN